MPKRRLNRQRFLHNFVQVPVAEVQVGRLNAPHQPGKCLVAGNQIFGPVDTGVHQLLSDLSGVELVDKPAQDLGFRIVLTGWAETRRDFHPTGRRV